jgi:putative molybdopterin biosynthesis protein
MADTLSQLMTPQEVADYLRVHVLTIYRYIKAGEIPAAKIGGRYRIDQADVVRFLKNRKQSMSNN